jgi:hypothetical protein
MPKTAGGQAVLRLRIRLNEVDPMVWRLLLVPGTVRLSKLADMLLAAMGWTNSHLHAFRVGDRRYGMHVEDYPDHEIDERTVTALDVLQDEPGFDFDYDFGDGWEHEVAVEEILKSSIGMKYAVCLDGANACPPEDVGGASGYESFLRAICDPNHDEYQDYLSWIGEPFDPAAFNPAQTNALLQRLR